MYVFDLAGDRYSGTASFSKGIVSKVLMSAALLLSPEVLLLDKPLFAHDFATALVVGK
ncbi:MAG: hypothetical protein QME85_09965 [Candidatus Saccharicenans sp.]|nr:hypothetical protein [Candidatus Saccharicenans sp.]